MSPNKEHTSNIKYLNCIEVKNEKNEPSTEAQSFFIHQEIKSTESHTIYHYYTAKGWSIKTEESKLQK